MAITTISPQELAARQERGEACVLIDVRTPVEFREVHVTFARNVPLDQLNPAALASTRSDASQPLFVICRSGNRASQACEKFIAAGCNNIVNVTGGTLAWEQAGLPVTRGKKAVSLERQVRIAAGLLVLIGIGLSFAHPYWIGLSAFAGAGLVFAGITDTCGMGMLLARMPWNQVPDKPEEQQDSSGTSCSINRCCG
jgi:rhodanese-related sulfurtransferase